MISFPTHSNRLELIRQTVPNSGLMAEIGVNRAEFSQAILCNTKISRLYLVDPWVPYYAGVQKWSYEQHNESFVEACRVAGMHHNRAVVLRMTSEEASKLDAVPMLDAVYIDADHRWQSVMHDLQLWSKKIKPGGVIMGHDYIDTPQAKLYAIEVVEAVTMFCLTYGWEVTALTDELFSSFRLERKK